jgi:YVTN family beta-propeller protein
VGSAPGPIAITPDGKTAYVVNQNSGTVIPVSTATNTALKAIASLARRALLALGGAGVTPETATGVGARLMAGGPVTEAERAGRLR